MYRKGFKNIKYETSRKYVQWKSPCSVRRRDRQTDRQTDRTDIRNPIVAFRNCSASAPKNQNFKPSLAAVQMRTES
jgi:hypothetical protein